LLDQVTIHKLVDKYHGLPSAQRSPWGSPKVLHQLGQCGCWRLQKTITIHS